MRFMGFKMATLKNRNSLIKDINQEQNLHRTLTVGVLIRHHSPSLRMKGNSQTSKTADFP
jgi:hypothetical protein